MQKQRIAVRLRIGDELRADRACGAGFGFDHHRLLHHRLHYSGERAPDHVRRICSYVLAETSGELGTVCIYEASSPEAIRKHAYRAGLPVDEIIAVADTVVVQPDPQPVPA